MGSSAGPTAVGTRMEQRGDYNMTGISTFLWRILALKLALQAMVAVHSVTSSAQVNYNGEMDKRLGRHGGCLRRGDLDLSVAVASGADLCAKQQ